ncbi:HNH endonuclease [Streptosporangium roseum]|uniref:Restriction endonuclease n=1 Tax=Streptosporangium roseum (strain ATCC 12428 / DSM 43021 / JCM 3005 / KCTC 9067 / NCIMB 10171 / NRRL 2505 / NI 9100) TaxID=479432 RepID=D2B5N9_STRRD|nr:HNH endonuclease [Streptosporangium roseum]ACZ91343.1 restriction endonuclease [Streptosporangium roseum DSM 43021]
MRAYVGVTDGNWYQFLADRPALTEANFWRPSGGMQFRALKSGEPFFFKTHHEDKRVVRRGPHNRVVGGGFFDAFEPLPLSEAWQIFGEANGAADMGQMRRRISQYRKQPIAEGEDPVIGCILLRDTRFFDPPASAPPDFAPNIVQGKGYDLAVPEAGYFRELVARLLDGRHVEGDLTQPWRREGPVFGDPRLVPQRLGQGAFQAVVLNAYHRQCAITGSRILPALQAAHIRPVSAGGQHRLDNGILLRSDVHTLFDRGYLGIDAEYRLCVSPRLREQFGDGDEFYQRAGAVIALPDERHDRPDRDALEWHLREVFLAS